MIFTVYILYYSAKIWLQSRSAVMTIAADC